jgi:hypothetical protein
LYVLPRIGDFRYETYNRHKHHRLDRELPQLSWCGPKATVEPALTRDR